MDVPFANMAEPSASAVEKPGNKMSSLADKLRKPFKKRHSTVYHQPTSRVNKYLAQAINARSVDQEKSTHINVFTLCFKDGQKERQYYAECDYDFANSMVCCLTVVLFIGSLQVIVLARSLLLIVAFLAAFLWISVFLSMALGAKLNLISFNISKIFQLRMAVIVLSILSVHGVTLISALSCTKEPVSSCSPLVNASEAVTHYDPYRCPLPQYIIISFILTFLSIVSFIRFPIILKSALLLPMTVLYIVTMEIIQKVVFTCYDERFLSAVAMHDTGVVVVLHFVLAVLIHGRQVEWTARLDFLWNVQANEEKREMHDLQNSNRRILFNLLPAHVATHFLDNQFKNNMDLYNQSYSKVGVVFASIPNFHEFYMELDGNNQGMECLRLLNEIIADFDELLDDERFKAIDKIKTVGSTYMAAIGLMPEYRIPDGSIAEAARYMEILVEMVFAFKDKLADINENSYNNFMLRVGLNIGPVVAGVIGASKPQYDIWGNTVNVASRMDSTGLPNHTQVTEDVYSLLKEKYVFHCRGIVKVKGKGDMTTYFLLDRKKYVEPPPGEETSPNKGKSETEGNSILSSDPTLNKTTSNTQDGKQQLAGENSNKKNSSNKNWREKQTNHHYLSHENDIRSTVSPKLTSAQLLLQPQTEYSPSQSNLVICSPTDPSQSISNCNSKKENTAPSNSVPELKDVLYNKLQMLNTHENPYRNKVYRPSKLLLQSKRHSLNASAAISSSPEEVISIPASSPSLDSETSNMHESVALLSDINVIEDSTHSSLLDLNQNNSTCALSANYSPSTSCESFVRSDDETTLPAIFDYPSSAHWIYAYRNSHDFSENDIPKRDESIKPNIQLVENCHSFPEVGFSPSHAITGTQAKENYKFNNYQGDTQLTSDCKKLTNNLGSSLTNATSLESENDISYPTVTEAKYCKEILNSNIADQIKINNMKLHQPLINSEQRHNNTPLPRISTAKSCISDDHTQALSTTVFPHDHVLINKIPIMPCKSSSKENEAFFHASKFPTDQGYEKIMDSEHRKNLACPKKDKMNNNSIKECTEVPCSSCAESTTGLNFYLNGTSSSNNPNSDHSVTKFTNRHTVCVGVNPETIKQPLILDSSNHISSHFISPYEYSPSESENKEKNCLKKRISGNKLLPPHSSVTGLTDSDESEDDEKSDEGLLTDEQDFCSNDPALENVSLLNEHGLTDTEGALSDLNSVNNDTGHDDDNNIDDISTSSKASSKMFDNDQLLSVDSLNIAYDSEFDDYRPGMINFDAIFQEEKSMSIDTNCSDD